MNYFKISLGVFIALVCKQVYSSSTKFYKFNCIKFVYTSLLWNKIFTYSNNKFCYNRFYYWFSLVTFFTWGSVVLIGLLSKFFFINILTRISGALIGACLFFLITNFGVWSLGSYGYTLEGLVTCYILAIPFFGNTIISTILFSTLLETVYFYFQKFSKKENV